MSENHHIWRVWVRILHRWGLEEAVAAILETLGPLTLVGAQAVYVTQPLLRSLVPQPHLEAAARLLEDGDETAAFVSYLREAV